MEMGCQVMIPQFLHPQVECKTACKYLWLSKLEVSKLVPLDFLEESGLLVSG